MSELKQTSVALLEKAIDDKIKRAVKGGQSTHLATVTRVSQDGTTWVHVFGGSEETPVRRMTTAASVGDIINVTFSGLSCMGVGNVSSPSATERQVQKVEHSTRTIAAAAKDAWDHADDAAMAAQNAWDHANDAAQAAQTAWDHADEAADAASDASRSADNALVQLSIVEDVAGTLDWISKHGTYTATSDTAVVEGKVYFEYDSTTHDYTPVVSPPSTANPSNEGWYVLDVTDSQSDFIMAHLAVTSRGLWVLPSGIGSSTTPATGESQADSDARQGSGYKLLLSNDGTYVYDGTGALVIKYGQNIEPSTDRPFYIGDPDSTSYILFTPASGSTPASISIGGSVKISTSKTLSELLAEVDAKAARGTGILKVTTAPSSYTTQTGGFTPSYRIALSTVKSQAGVDDVVVGDVIEYSYYHYPVGYVDSSYAYTGARTSIRGATGTAGGRWYSGTGITGTSTTATIFSGSGVSSAVVGDMYLNTDTNNTYRCTTAGNESTAKWVYVANIEGEQGIQGETGPQGPQGEQGVQGPAGTSVTVSKVEYATSTSETQPSSGWSTTAPSTVAEGSWLWVKTTYSDGTDSVTRAKQGKSGTNGTSYYTHVRYSASSDGTNHAATPSSTTKYIGIYTGTSSTAPSSKSSYTWSKYVGEDGSAGHSPSITTSYDSTNHVTTIYADGTSIGTVADGEDGTTPTITASKSGGTTTVKVNGSTIATINDGTSVTVSKVEYGTSSSASTSPSSWSTTVPTSITKGNWLWVKTTYSDNSTATTKSYVGTDGEDGKSVYVASTSKTDGVTTVTLSDGTTTTTIQIADGEDGENGQPGAAGDDSYVHFAWANSADGATGFSTTVSAGKLYMGVYSDNTLADSQTPTDYSWTLVKGETGDAAQWYYGTALTHTSGTATLATSSTAGVVVGAMYLNNSTSLCYRCTAVSGTTATWTYAGNLTDGVIDNINVGGRNLLLQSQLFGTAEKTNRIVGKFSNGLLVSRADGFNEIQANANFRGISVYADSMGFAVGEKLILSTNVRSDSTVGTSLIFYCMAFDASGTRIQTALLHLKTRATQGDGASANIYANYSFPAGAEERIIVEITWLQAAQDLLDAGGNIRFTIQATSSDWSKGNVAMWAPKLERGNVATDWTPAPEDTIDEEQYIYCQSDSILNVPTIPEETWITSTGESVSDDATPIWTTKPPTYRTTHPVTFVAKQRMRLDGTIICSTPVMDDTVTVLNGSNIVVGAIDAKRVDVINLNAANISAGYISADRIRGNSLSIEKLGNDVMMKFGDYDEGLRSIVEQGYNITALDQRADEFVATQQWVEENGDVTKMMLGHMSYSQGKLTLDASDGESNATKAVLSTEKLAFESEGAEVAYFSNQKLYVTNAQVLDTMQMGGFAWIPRSNGNLSLKWVGGVSHMNLLRGTKTLASSDWALTRSTVDTSANCIRITPTNNSAMAKLKVDYLDYADYGKGTYTVSCDVRLADVTSSYEDVHFNLYLGFSTASRIANTFSSSYDRYKYFTFTDLTTDWISVSATYAVPSSLTTGKEAALVNGSKLSVQVYAGVSSKPIEVRNVKLEIGSEATPWSANPND